MAKFIFNAAQQLTIQHICDEMFKKGEPLHRFLYNLAYAAMTLHVKVERHEHEQVDAEQELITLMKIFGYAEYNGAVIKLEQ